MDLRQGVADQLDLALLGHEVPEALIFLARLLELRFERPELAAGAEPRPAEPCHGEQHDGGRDHGQGIPHPFAEPRQLRLQPGER
jgi:hypothetical protein